MISAQNEKFLASSNIRKKYNTCHRRRGEITWDRFGVLQCSLHQASTSKTKGLGRWLSRVSHKK